MEQVVENSEQGSGSDNQIIVVGGGVSGLCAAAALSKAGENVVILEAANYLGGRVRQVQPYPNFAPIDVGAELVHGSTTVLNKLINERGWPFDEVFDFEDLNEKLQVYYKGKFYNNLSLREKMDIFRSMRTNSAVVKYGNKQLALKKKGKSFEDKSAFSVLTDAGYSENDIAIFRDMFCQAFAADVHTLGAMDWAGQDKFDFGSQNYRLKDSYAVLVKHLLSECEKVDKRLDWQVTEVNWQEKKSGDKWSVCVKNGRGEEISGDGIIVTVPLGILKANDIVFNPPLSQDKQQVINSMQMLGGFKIACRFREPFWSAGSSVMTAIGEFIPQFWVYSKKKLVADQAESCYIVTGFNTADSAQQKAGMTKEQIAEKFLEQLDRMFGSENYRTPATDRYMNDFTYFNWSEHPYTKGAYSSPSVGVSDEKRGILAAPVGNLVLGGEHVCDYSSTVYSAMDSGQRAAKFLMESLDKRAAENMPGLLSSPKSKYCVLL